MEAVLIIGNDVNLNNYDFKNKYVIGVDEGAIIALKAGIKLDLAIGDFDSVNSEEFHLISERTSFVKLNPVKNDTDTHAALKYCQEATKITILGGIQGKRIEHFLANLLMLKNDSRIELIDNNSHIFSIDSSINIKKNKYQYISIFALENTKELTLKGFKYPLMNYELAINNPLGISNEIIDEEAVIEFKEGKLLIVMSLLDRLL